MNTVVHNLLREIEYLSALAEMYRQARDYEAQATALEARAALEHLVCILNHSTDRLPPEFPAAA